MRMSPPSTLSSADDHARQRRLARARLPHHTECAATRHGDRGVDDGVHRLLPAAVIGLRDPERFEHSCGRSIRHAHRWFGPSGWVAAGIRTIAVHRFGAFRRHAGERMPAIGVSRRVSDAVPGQRRRAREERRRRGDEAAGVLRLRVAQHVVRAPLLDDASAAHHVDAVAERGGEIEVVRDEEHAHAPACALLAEHADDLGLRGDVEGRGGLVAHQQSRRRRERTRDHDALQHAARELVRILAQVLLGARQAHGGEQFDGACSRGIRRPSLGQPQRFCQVVADGAHRVDAGARVLEDHGRAVTAEPAQRRGRWRSARPPRRARPRRW